jgi:hypothetical protein
MKSRKGLICCLLLVGALLGLANNSSAAVLFQEDFESGNISKWIQYDTDFTVQNFNGNNVLSGAGSGVAYISAPDWTDYTVEADLYLWDGNYWAYAFGLLFRAEGEGSFSGMNAYMLQLRPYEFEIEKWTKGNGWSYVATGSGVNTQPGKWYHFKVSCEGARIKAYVDDVLVVDLTDSSPILSGGVGMRIWGAGAYLDNVKVTVPDVDVYTKISQIKEQILALPAEAFDNNAPNRKDALCSKLEEVSNLVRSNYLKDARNKLSNDIMAKMDGAQGGFPGNDWIVDAASQRQIYLNLLVVLKTIEGMK